MSLTLLTFSILTSIGQEARSLAPARTDPIDPPADLIVEGRIFTADSEHPWAEAVAIRGERIAAVGSRADMERWRGPETELVAGGERTVVPGFNDAHCHFSVGFGMNQGVDLGDAVGLESILERVYEYAQAHPEVEVIEGGHWDLADMPGEDFPTAGLLDEIVPDRPVLLWSDGPHGLWVNSAAMAKAGIDGGSTVPGATVFLRDEEGEPTGVFLGRGLFGLFRFTPPPDVAAMQDGILAGLEEARRLGVTSVHESVPSFLVPYWAELYDAGELTLRMHVWGGLTASPFGGGLDEHLAQAKAWARSDWLTFGTLKGGVDGMPGLRTAAMLAPYADDPSSAGLLIMDPELVGRAVRAANEKGVRVALHATGDRGVRLALEALLSGERPDLHNRLEHAFLVAKEDVERIAAGGIVVSTQPSFLSVDLGKGRFYESRLGPERLGEALPLRSLLDAGVQLAFGTDFSLTPLNPMVGLYAAVTRRALDGTPAEGWVPAERITLEEAVRAYTLGSAIAEGAEADKGTLALGKLADLVLLSKDIFAIEPEELLGVTVERTIVGGRVVFER